MFHKFQGKRKTSLRTLAVSQSWIFTSGNLTTMDFFRFKWGFSHHKTYRDFKDFKNFKTKFLLPWPIGITHHMISHGISPRTPSKTHDGLRYGGMMKTPLAGRKKNMDYGVVLEKFNGWTSFAIARWDQRNFLQPNKEMLGRRQLGTGWEKLYRLNFFSL